MPSFMNLKIKLYSILIGGALLTFVFHFELNWSDEETRPIIFFKLFETNWYTIGICALTALFLTLINALFKVKNDRFEERLERISKNPNIPEHIKIEIITRLINIKNRLGIRGASAGSLNILPRVRGALLRPSISYPAHSLTCPAPAC